MRATVSCKGKILVRSANHIDRIVNNSIAAGTFAKPTIVHKDDFEPILEGRSGRTSTPKRSKPAPDAAAKKSEGARRSPKAKPKAKKTKTSILTGLLAKG